MHWLLIFAWGILHPFYISVTEINHNTRSNRLEITLRIFADDFESALKQKYKTQLDIIKPNDKKKVDSLISIYVKEHLHLVVEKKKLPFKFIGYEWNDASVWCYFETEPINTFKTITVGNSILHDFTEQQVNMIHVKTKGKTQSTKLDYPKSAHTFEF